MANRNSGDLNMIDIVRGELKDIVGELKEVHGVAKEVDKTSINIDLNIKGLDKLDDAKEKLNGLFGDFNKLNKPQKTLSKYFQSIENGAEGVKNSWNKMIQIINSSSVDKTKGIDGLFEDREIKSAALEVYKFANAFTALGGNVGDISKEISNFVEQISKIQTSEGKIKYSASSGYFYDVESFKQVFNILSKINAIGENNSINNIFGQIGINVGSFEEVLDITTSLLSINREYTYSVKQSSDAASEGYSEQANAARNAKKEIEALTKEQVKQRALDKYKKEKLYSDYDVNDYYDWEYDKSDIEKYSAALKDLQEQQERALDSARYYQNRYAEAFNEFGADDSKTIGLSDDMERYFERYVSLTSQVEYVQEKLNEAVTNFDPTSVSGSNEQWIVLIKLMQDASKYIEELNKSIGSIGDDENFKPLLSSIEDIKNAFSDVTEEINNLQFALQNINQNYNIKIDNSGEGSKKQQQIDQFLNKTLLSYQKEYEKFFKGGMLNADLIFSALAGSRGIQNQIGEGNLTQDYFENLYGKAALSNVSDQKDRIERIIDFLKYVDIAVKENADATDTFWSELKSANKSVRRSRDKGAFVTLLNKKYKEEEDKVSEETKSAVNDILDDSEAQNDINELSRILELLEQINNILSDVAENTITLKVDLDGMEELKTTLSSLNDFISNINNSSNLKSISDEFISAYSKIKNIAEYNSKSDDFSFFGNPNSEQWDAISKITDLIPKLKEAGIDIEELKSSYETVETVIKQYGKNTVQGFINGAESTTDEEVECFTKLANIPKDVIETVLQIHSPSKVMEELGEFTGEGFKLGVGKSLNDVKNSILEDIKSMTSQGEDAIQIWRDYIRENSDKFDPELKLELDKIINYARPNMSKDFVKGIFSGAFDKEKALDIVSDHILKGGTYSNFDWNKVNENGLSSDKNNELEERISLLKEYASAEKEFNKIQDELLSEMIYNSGDIENGVYEPSSEIDELNQKQEELYDKTTRLESKLEELFGINPGKLLSQFENIDEAILKIEEITKNGGNLKEYISQLESSKRNASELERLTELLSNAKAGNRILPQLGFWSDDDKNRLLSKVYEIRDLANIEPNNDIEKQIRELATELLPYAIKQYEELMGQPVKFSVEQEKVLDALKHEQLETSDVLELWDKLNISAEKSVAILNGKTLNATNIGTSKNVNIEYLDNIPQFDTLLHSHPYDSTFSPDDILPVIDNWDKGLRKLYLWVNGRLESLDFSNTTKEVVQEFYQELYEAVNNYKSEDLKKGIDVGAKEYITNMSKNALRDVLQIVPSFTSDTIGYNQNILSNENRISSGGETLLSSIPEQAEKAEKSIEEVRAELTKLVTSGKSYDSNDISKILGISNERIGSIQMSLFGLNKADYSKALIDELMRVYEILNKEEAEVENVNSEMDSTKSKLESIVSLWEQIPQKEGTTRLVHFFGGDQAEKTLSEGFISTDIKNCTAAAEQYKDALSDTGEMAQACLSYVEHYADKSAVIFDIPNNMLASLRTIESVLPDANDYNHSSIYPKEWISGIVDITDSTIKLNEAYGDTANVLKLIDDKIAELSSNGMKSPQTLHFLDELKNVREYLSQPNESDILFEEPSGQIAFFDGLKESQEEIREEILKTDEQIKGQLSLFDNPVDVNANETAESISSEGNAAEKASSKIEELTSVKKRNKKAEQELSNSTKETSESLEQEGKSAEEAAKEIEAQASSIEDIINNQTDEIKGNIQIIDPISDEENLSILNQISEVQSDIYHLSKLQADADKNRNKVLQEEQKIRLALEKSENKQKEKDAKALTDLNQSLGGRLKRANDILDSSEYTNNGGFKDSLRDLIKQVDKIDRGDIDKVNEYNEALKNLLNGDSAKDAKQGLAIKLANLRKQIAQTLKKNTKMGAGLREQYTSIDETISQMLEGNIAYTRGDIQKLIQDLAELDAEMVNTGQSGDSAFKKISNRLQDMNSKFIAQYLSWQDIIRYIRTISSTVIELDTALTELRKVSDASTERLQQSFQKSADTAKELGRTITDVINVTADWSRLGYSIDEAEELAKVTTLFQNVGDNMDAQSASSYMISTLQGFQLEADKAIEVADKFNEVANNFAIDTQGIGESLKRSAASFNAANTDLSESIALVTATNAVVQDPESVGTMWKTVSARIRGAKTELEDMGEDTEGMVESTSKLRDLVKGYTGFDIMQDEDTFKSIYDIIVGIGEKWEDLTDIQQAGLLEALAGKRAGNALAATLNNIDDLKAAYETAEKSAGSAQKEQENYEKSIQYSIDRLKATAQDLAQDFIKSDWIKTAVDGLNSILELVDKLVEHTGSLVPILTTIAGIIISIKATQGIGNVAGAIQKFNEKDNKTSILSSLFNTSKIKDFLGKEIVIKKAGEEIGSNLIEGTISSISKSQASQMISEALLAEAQTGMSAATYASMEFGVSLESLQAIEVGTTAATTELGAAAAGTAVSMGAIIGIAAAVVAGIVAVVAIVDALTISVEEANKYMENWNSTLDELNSKLQKQKDVAKEAKESYAKLAEGVNTLNNTNINLSDEDYAEFIRLNNELAEQFPELKTGIDDEGNAIINLGDNSAQTASKLNDLIERQERLANLKIADALPDTFENTKVLMDDSIKKTKEYESEIKNTNKELTSINKVINSIGQNDYSNLTERIISSNSDIEFYNALGNAIKKSGLNESDLRMRGAYGEDGIDISYERWIDFSLLSDEEKEKISNALYNDAVFVRDKLINNINDLDFNIDDENKTYEAYWQSFVLDNVLPTMYTKGTYDKLSSTGKNIADALVEGLSAETAEKMSEYEDPYDFIQNNIINKMDLIEDAPFNIMDLFSGELSNEELSNLYKQIQDYFNLKRIDIKLNIGEESIKVENEFDKNINSIIGNGKNISDRGYSSSYDKHINQDIISDSEKLRKITKEFDIEQKKAWIDVTNGAKNAEEAVKRWNDYLKESEQLVKEISKGLSTSDTIDELSKLESNLDNLDKAFAELFDPDDMQVDLSSVKAIKDAFIDMDENFDLSSIESQLETLYNATSAEEAQQAVNELCDAFLRQSDILSKLDSNNRNLVESELERLGITNAHILVLDGLDKAGKELTETEKAELEAIRGTTVGNKEAKEYFEKRKKATDEAVIGTKEDVQALFNEKEAAELDTIALGELELAEIAANEAEMDFSQQIAALETLFAQLNLDTEACYGLAAALALKNQMEVKGLGSQYDFFTGDGKNQYEQRQKDVIQSAITDARKSLKDLYKPITPDYTNSPSVQAARDASDSASDTTETFDWIETAIQRVQRAITNLGKIVSATYRNWSSRNSSIASEMAEVTKEINLQSSAYDAYMNKANSVGLSEQYKNLVMNGGLKIEEIADENLKKQIQTFKEWYEKALAAADAIEDLNSQLAQLARQKFDNVKNEFQGMIDEIEHFTNMIDKELESVEIRGKIAGKSFYEAKIGQSTSELAKLQEQREAMYNALRDAESHIEPGSEEWVNMRNEIYSVDESIADLENQILELKEKIKEIAQLEFDDFVKQFENAISIVTRQIDITDSVVSLVESTGHIASKAYYEALAAGTRENITGLRKEYEKLTIQLNQYLASGDIEMYSDQWYSMQESIDEVKSSLIDATQQLVEYEKAMRQIDWDLFDRGVQEIDNLISEAEFFKELLSHEKLFDNGLMTDAGMTTQGLLVENYQSYIEQAKAYGEEAAKIKDDLFADPKNIELLDRYQELISAQRESILNSLEEKEAIKELAQEGYDNLIDKISDLIEKYKEALQEQKDLFEYQKTIDEKNKNINSLQKQIIAYSGAGANTEENRATLQKLNADLIEAQRDLEETEYEKSLEDQEALLDNFLEQLEDWINDRLDNLDELLEEAIAATDLNGQIIDQTLHTESDKVNYTMTDEFMKLWDSYSSPDGIASTSMSILDLTSLTTTDIRTKMNELATEAGLEAFLQGDDLRLLQELTSVNGNTNAMNNAINTTNSALNQIHSSVVEYSGREINSIEAGANKITDAINNKDLSVVVNVSVSGGNGGGGSSVSTSGGGSVDGGTSSSSYYIGKNGEYGNYGSAQEASKAADALAQQEIDDMKGHVPLSVQGILADQIREKYRVYHYAKGGLISDKDNPLDVIAHILGEDHMIAAKEGERILTPTQNIAFEKLVDNLSNVDILSGIMGNSKPNVKGIGSYSGTTTVGDVSINLPNVTNKQEFVTWLKNDGQIEKIIQSMTVGKIAGGNSYAKMKY